MAVVYVCDGCGKRRPGFYRPANYEHEDPRTRESRWFKPGPWYEREDEDGQQHACSRKCVEKVAEKSGKTSVVLPI